MPVSCVILFYLNRSFKSIQTINRSITSALTQTNNSSIHQTINHSIHHPINPSTNYSPTNLSINKWEYQAINQSNRCNQATNQTIIEPNQSIHQSITQPTNQSSNQSINQSIKRSTNRSFKQSNDQTINPPINQSITQWVSWVPARPSISWAKARPQINWALARPWSFRVFRFSVLFRLIQNTYVDFQIFRLAYVFVIFKLSRLLSFSNLLNMFKFIQTV